MTVTTAPERDLSYAAVMARKDEILARASSIDYPALETDRRAFDYERLMASASVGFDEARAILRRQKAGDTPLWELRALTEHVRRFAPADQGARIFLKDEAGNASGSFKARRAALAVSRAARLGYPGVIAASSGNYGAAVASQAAMQGLRCIIVQEVFDSAHRGQPEILEKTRACEAYGAEVWRLTVGPELFYLQLRLLEETGYFNASLYIPDAILGVETLGAEIIEQARDQYGVTPAAVLVTHAGGGNVTGTARGIRRATAEKVDVIGVSVDLSGLHMASDRDFNRKSFTTGHTGFGFPFAIDPDRSEVPRNAARSLRYLDRYVTVPQGSVFLTTELLARLEGIERGPAGNTSLTAALALAAQYPRDAALVVQETEYTGAGKHPTAQLAFAAEVGVEVRTGSSADDLPGARIIIPTSPADIGMREVDLQALRLRYLRHVIDATGNDAPSAVESTYLAAELNVSAAEFTALWNEATK